MPIMSAECINKIEVGCRIWTEHGGLFEQRNNSVNVPAKTGGTITSIWNEFTTINDPLCRVQWDTGQITIFYCGNLFSIGRFKTLAEFEAFILAEAQRAELVLGPMGGFRSLTIFLRNGDWINGTQEMSEDIKYKNIPVEVVRLEKKKRGPYKIRRK
jgi:hypothetical protein